MGVKIFQESVSYITVQYPPPPTACENMYDLIIYFKIRQAMYIV